MKIREFLKKNIFSIVGGVLVLGVSIVLADNLQASSIQYDKQNSTQYGATKDYVQDAIDELYVKGQAKLATVQAQASTTTIYSMPRLVYLDPTNLAKVCRQSDLVASDVNNKIGCMKWYIYGETGNKYIAILDHNTTAQVSSGWEYAKTTQLTSDTTGWSNALTVRLITAEEVAKITGADIALSFNASSSDYFYFDGAYGSDNTWQTSVANSSTKSRYAWLYDYTAYNSSNTCTKYGCNANPNSSYYTYGYWTSTSKNASSAWLVGYIGRLSNTSVSFGDLGVRPVIEFSKSILLNRS